MSQDFVKIELAEFEDLFTHMAMDSMALGKKCGQAARMFNNQAEGFLCMERLCRGLGDKVEVLLDEVRQRQKKTEEDDCANVQ